MLSSTPEWSKSCRIAGDTVGKDTAASKAPDSKPRLPGGGALVKPGGDFKKNASDSEP